MAKPKPNILFFLPDQFRSDWILPQDGVPVQTPNIQRLSKNGVRFSKAYTPSPLCAPARACLASGRNYQDCGVQNNWQNFPLELPTYYQALRDNGYEVAGVGKFDLHKDVRDFANLWWGLEGSHLLKEWGFTRGIDNEGKIDGIHSYLKNDNIPRGPYMNYLHNRGLAGQYIEDYTKGRENDGIYINSLPEEAYCDNWISQNGLDILKQIPQNHPWHLVINFTGPHSPMDVTRAMKERWTDQDFAMPKEKPDCNTELERQRRQNYAAMIENIDRNIGRYLDFLEESGQLENTLIIFSSDHGEMLGDHSCQGKCVWYEPSVKIPLVISGPDIAQNRDSDALLNLQDICATILDYTGSRELPQMYGQSLRPILAGETESHRDYVHSSLVIPSMDSASRCKRYDWQMITDGRYKYVRDYDSEFLFDLQDDPHETNNLSLQEPEISNRLKEQLK